MTDSHADFVSASFADGRLARALGDNWWLLLLRGIAAILLGALAFAAPGLTILSLTLVWGAYAFADGVFALAAAVVGKAAPATPRWWLALAGLAGICVGIVAFAWPALTVATLVLFIAIWALVVGLSQILGALALRKEIEGEWWLILSGAISLLFGVALIGQPAVGALSLVWLIGFYALMAGVCLVLLSLRVRAMKTG